MLGITEPYQQLEKEFGEFAGFNNVVACSSGTAALHLALLSLNLPTGGQVIVPEFTNVACARACTLAGLRPVFVDCRDDLLIDPAQIEQSLTGYTVAIMPVHIYGRHCDMESITNLAGRYGLFVIEDCAEYHGGDLGTHHSDAYCWSFYKNKIVAGEEGGMVAFKRNSHAQSAWSLRNLGQDSLRPNYLHMPGGHNYRMSNAHAELVLNSLSRVESSLRVRRSVADRYQRELGYPLTKGIEFMPDRVVDWVYDLRVPGLDAPTIVKFLNDKGIAARMAFKPMSEQEEYRGHWLHLSAYARSRDTFYLPVPSVLPEDGYLRSKACRDVADAVQAAVRSQSSQTAAPNKTMWS